MSDIIKLLPDSVANQIAAGEVVQRPVSVVKELLENAIDAAGRTIKLILKDAGKTLIQVVDDGIGMSETDARLCFERHATSKIQRAEDLFAIRTMGFRGEAMAAIASVAQVELRTKKRDQELGTRVVIEGSKVLEQSPCQTAVGTSVSVKNLFFNIPARRQFLKSDSIELRHIVEEFQQIALAHCDLFFSLHHNEERLFHLPPAPLRQRIVHLFGNKINEKLIPIEERTDVLGISGYIGKPEYAKKTRGEQYFFVNNRFIRSNYLHHAVMSAYEDLLPVKHYPFYAIFLDIDPARIDVNVHPTKQEIKFDDERLVYNYLRVTARHGLAQSHHTPQIDFDTEPAIDKHLDASKLQPDSDAPLYTQLPVLKHQDDRSERQTGNNDSRRERNPLYESNLRNWERLYEGLGKEGGEGGDAPEDHQTFASKLSVEPALFDQDAGGIQKEPYQLHNQLIISPIKSGFMVIDQNAAHRRILYERYLDIYRNREALPQQELFPHTIQLSPADAALLKSMLDELQQLGLVVEALSGNAFVVQALPAEWQAGNLQTLLEDLLEQHKQNLQLRLGLHESLARSMAGYSAIPAGKALERREMQLLIDQLFACSLPHLTPCGRKTFFVMDLSELLARFD